MNLSGSATAPTSPAVIKLRAVVVAAAEMWATRHPQRNVKSTGRFSEFVGEVGTPHLGGVMSYGVQSDISPATMANGSPKS